MPMYVNNSEMHRSDFIRVLMVVLFLVYPNQTSG